jgi:hypothetical protein
MRKAGVMRTRAQGSERAGSCKKNKQELSGSRDTCQDYALERVWGKLGRKIGTVIGDEFEIERSRGSMFERRDKWRWLGYRLVTGFVWGRVLCLVRVRVGGVDEEMSDLQRMWLRRSLPFGCLAARSNSNETLGLEERDLPVPLALSCTVGT